VEQDRASHVLPHHTDCAVLQPYWRGKSLVSRVAVVNLIAATTTKTGLTVLCELDQKTYAKGH